MKNILVGTLLVLSGGLIFASVESAPGGMLAGNPTTHVVDGLNYLADTINTQSVPGYNEAGPGNSYD